MVWKVKFAHEAEKDLKALDKQYAKKILKYLSERIATSEDPRRFGEPLKANLSGLWKYRVGTYRIICDMQDKVLTVLILRVGHRREVYKKSI